MGRLFIESPNNIIHSLNSYMITDPEQSLKCIKTTKLKYVGPAVAMLTKDGKSYMTYDNKKFVPKGDE